MRGVIVRGVGGLYTVISAGVVYTCVARGLFKLRKITPLIGDRVEIEVTDEAAGAGQIIAIEERATELVRPRAANVDICICVMAAAEPAPVLESLDITIINATAAGLAPVVCVNKVDLAAEGFVAGIRLSYSAFDCVFVSVKTGEGLDRLRRVIAGKTAALSGVSGVGKSSIINATAQNSLMAVGDLSERIKRGKHTTRHAELIGLSDNTYIIDTPGFSNIELLTSRTDIDAFYPEFAPYIGQCYYTDCRHITEHNCAVKAQIGNTIDQGRYERYVGICSKLSRR